jgi:hypothetical protein
MDIEHVLEIKILPSKRMKIYLVSSHFFFIIVTIMLNMHFEYKLFIVFALIFSIIFLGFKYQFFRGQNLPIYLSKSKDNLWKVRGSDTAITHELNLISCFVNTYFVVLIFKHKEKCWPTTLCIFHDSVDSDLFRTLRVYCRTMTTFQK